MEWDISLDENVINVSPINYRQLQVPLTTFVSFFFFFALFLPTRQVSLIVFVSFKTVDRVEAPWHQMLDNFKCIPNVLTVS